MKDWSVKWESNGAVLSLHWHDEPPTDEPTDVLEFIVQPAEGYGERRSWYMNKDDAVAIIYLMSRALLEMQMEIETQEQEDERR